jgi:hypothetical protein
MIMKIYENIFLLFARVISQKSNFEKKIEIVKIKLYITPYFGELA